jgi:hypothetical protein
MLSPSVIPCLHMTMGVICTVDSPIVVFLLSSSNDRLCGWVEVWIGHYCINECLEEITSQIDWSVCWCVVLFLLFLKGASREYSVGYEGGRRGQCGNLQ